MLWWICFYSVSQRPFYKFPPPPQNRRSSALGKSAQTTRRPISAKSPSSYGRASWSEWTPWTNCSAQCKPGESQVYSLTQSCSNIFTSRGWSGFTSFPSSSPPSPGDIYKFGPWPPRPSKPSKPLHLKHHINQLKIGLKQVQNQLKVNLKPV